MDKVRMRQAVIIAVLLLGLGLWLGSERPPFLVEPFTVEVSPGRALAGRLYLPDNETAPLPALLLCHGVNSSKDTMAPLAQTLARRGIAAVVFDFGGYGRSYRRPNSQAENLTDADAVLHWMRRHPDLDAASLGIAGHSMGGTTALELAKTTPDLKTTLVLSIGGLASPTRPANLLFASGVYEELNSVGSMRSLFTTATAAPTPPFEIAGSFADGTARQLVFSPTVDHALAPYDANLHHAAIRWVEQSFGLPTAPVPRTAQAQLLGQVLTAMAAMTLAIARYIPLVRWGGRPIMFASAGLISVALISGQGWTAGIAVGGLFGMMAGNYGYSQADAGDTARRLLMGGGLLYGLALLAIVVNAIATGSLLAIPTAIGGLPILAKTVLVGLFYDRFHMVRYFLLTRSGCAIALSLLALELYRPGLVVASLDAIVRRTVTTLRQPLAITWQPLSGKSVALIGGLLTILAVLLVQQQRSGLLTGEALAFTGRLLGIFVLLPSVLGGLVLRSPLFKTWE